MTADVSALINLYRFPTGRRLFALRRVYARAGRGERELKGLVSEAIAHEELSWNLELRWRQERGRPRHAPQASGLDAKLDRALSGLSSALLAPIQAFGEESPEGEAAATLRSAAFPDGVGAYATLTFTEEHEAVRNLLLKLSTRHREEVARLNLGSMLMRIKDLNDAFGEALDVGEGGPTWDEVSAAQEKGQRNLQKVVAWVLGHYLGDDADDRRARERLLGPILRQNEEIRSHRRRRRRPADVDPETGEERGEELGADPSEEDPEATGEATDPEPDDS